MITDVGQMLLGANDAGAIGFGREHGLLLDFVTGVKLTSGERREIALLIEGVRLKVYSQPYHRYAEIYGKKLRVIKWYVKQGQTHPGGPDLPPFDSPGDMPLWWGRVMKQRCPPSIMMAAQIATSPGAQPPTQAKPKPETKTSRKNDEPPPPSFAITTPICSGGISVTLDLTTLKA